MVCILLHINVNFKIRFIQVIWLILLTLIRDKVFLMKIRTAKIIVRFWVKGKIDNLAKIKYISKICKINLQTQTSYQFLSYPIALSFSFKNTNKGLLPPLLPSNFSILHYWIVRLISRVAKKMKNIECVDLTESILSKKSYRQSNAYLFFKLDLKRLGC